MGIADQAFARIVGGNISRMVVPQSRLTNAGRFLGCELINQGALWFQRTLLDG